MKRVFLFVYLISIIQVAFASGDSLVRFKDLVFRNEMERTAFKNHLAVKDFSLIVDLLLCPYEQGREVNAGQANKLIGECVQALQKEIDSKPEAKKVKIIYNHVHKRFLRIYKLNNSFVDIFEKGEYNCVSASALYALIFSRLNIPYQVKETPQHVYLVAYPATNKFMIETTRPDNGYYQFSDDFIKKYVNSLVKSKLISVSELDTSSVNSAFNRFFFSSEDVSLVQLAGIQFSNYGVYYQEDKKYENSISEIKKAYYLYPCERNKYLLKTTLLYQVSNNSYSDTNQVNNLALICRYNNLNDQDVSKEAIKQEFGRLMETQLINNSDYTAFDISYQKISGALKDSILLGEIAFMYHSELARLGYLNMKDHEYEMGHLKEAYKVNPRNANLQGIILAYIKETVLKGLSASSLLKDAEELSVSFDFLRTNMPFNRIKTACLLELSYQSFSLNDLVMGESYLKQFEKLCTDEKDIEPNPEFVEMAYSVAAGVYYKKGNFAKAKQFVKTGLIYAPQSFRLKQRLSQF